LRELIIKKILILLVLSNCSLKDLSGEKKISFDRKITYQKDLENFNILENIESYRPDTCSDMSRNPFMSKRYNFTNNE
jgi:hypothetical protein